MRINHTFIYFAGSALSCCDKLLLNILLKSFTRFNGNEESIPYITDLFSVVELGLLEEQGNESANHPGGDGWMRIRACLRWLCLTINYSNGVKIEGPGTAFGGPTTNDRDLRQMLISDVGQPTLNFYESTPGCYLYMFDFQGWNRRKQKEFEGDSSNQFIPDDSYYNLSIFRLEPL